MSLLSSLGLTQKEEESGDFGKGNLAQKQQLIEDMKGTALIDTEELAGAAGRMFNSFLKESRSAMSNVKSALTPEFVNRIMNAKQYKLQVMKSEE